IIPPCGAALGRGKA
ncbi:IlvGEDA operon leader peptide, partial [Enterobacter hormaechei]|nr:IlvGEDA operon leader peptide [Enterobacter hormaechei]